MTIVYNDTKYSIPFMMF